MSNKQTPMEMSNACEIINLVEKAINKDISVKNAMDIFDLLEKNNVITGCNIKLSKMIIDAKRKENRKRIYNEEWNLAEMLDSDWDK